MGASQPSSSEDRNPIPDIQCGVVERGLSTPVAIAPSHIPRAPPIFAIAMINHRIVVLPKEGAVPLRHRHHSFARHAYAFVVNMIGSGSAEGTPVPGWFDPHLLAPKIDQRELRHLDAILHECDAGPFRISTARSECGNPGQNGATSRIHSRYLGRCAGRKANPFALRNDIGQRSRIRRTQHPGEIVKDTEMIPQTPRRRTASWSYRAQLVRDRDDGFLETEICGMQTSA